VATLPRVAWWGDRVVPRVTDTALRSATLGRSRAEACADLHGRVLELGFGSGLNLSHLPPEVTGVGAVEPSDVGWEMSRHRREASRVPVERIGLDGQAVGAPDASYDSALCTFTLCTIPDAGAALAEVRRVLRPGGTFCFLEHGLAESARTQAWQHRLDPWQQRLVGGCHLTRDPGALLLAAGFTLRAVRTGPLRGFRGPAFLTYGYLGSATT
jgi:SAM-dependent methyltransferase